MQFLQRLGRALKRPFLALAFWIAAITWAMAQRTPEPAPSGGGADYTLSYFLVFLGVGLGLLVLLRPTMRRDREGPEQYVEKNVLREE